MSPPDPRRAPALPIDPHLPGIVAAVRGAGAAVVVAPPGSGKTTRVPAALLDGGLAGAGGRVLVLQPRRVAARLAARRIANERGGRLGDEVGFSTRFERRTSRATRLELLTEGLLVRRLQADPFLSGVGCVVLDEFHERSLQADLSLALLQDVRRSAREELAVVVMSATLDPVPVARFLGDCPVVEAPGRTFPVQVEYAARPSTEWIEPRAARAARRALAGAEAGHVLVFLPGVREIERTAALLREGDGRLDGVDVLPLHGRLGAAAQDRALAPSRRRKVVLATNIAETSVTLEGVVAVVDSGLARVPRFDPATGLTRLETVPIPTSSADQRAGRAGRTAPGRCLRLWTEGEHRQRRPAEVPEVRRADLARTVLELLAWGARPDDFDWFEAPPEGQVEAATEQLRRLGAVDGRGLTALGRRLSKMPVDPRLGRVVLAGDELAVLASAATAAALISEPDPFARGGLQGTGGGEGDLAPRLAALAELEWTGRAPRGADRRRLDEVRRVRDRLVQVAERSRPGRDRGDEPAEADGPLPGVDGGAAGAPEGDGARAAAAGSGGSDAGAPPLVRALLAGFPERLARRRAPRSDRFVLASGAGAVLDERCAVGEAELVIAVGLTGGRRGQRTEHRIRIAQPIEPGWLEPEVALELRWDGEREAVALRRIALWGQLVLADDPAPVAPDPVAAAELLASEAAAHPKRAFDPGKDEVQLLARLRFLAGAMPELELPAIDGWEALLPELASGRRSFAELRKAKLAPALLGRLSWRQRRALDEQAPERIAVPSGPRLRVDYTPDGPPVLAARIQQLFGWTQTPRIAAGRVPVMLHLLAPNGRPAQITQDLASFWSTTWSDVRKDLRGRYPKHAWPEDPTAG